MDEFLASLGRVAEANPTAALPVLLVVGVIWAVWVEKRMSKPESKDEKINLIRSIDNNITKVESKIDILLDRVKR